MVSFGLAAHEPGLSAEERLWRREARSAWLRVAVFAILIANLLIGEHDGNILVHVHVLAAYALATALALGLALARRGPLWSGTVFVVIDATLVVALFHEHLFDPSGRLDHSLTTTSLAIAFLLLTHAALRLAPRLILLFATLVVSGWLSLLSVAVLVDRTDQLSDAAHPSFPLLGEGAIAAAFAFASFVAYLLTWDHNLLVEQAIRSERRRHSLSRFFSPDVVAQLEVRRDALDLVRREAAVMFVDLRSFTRFAETAEPRDLVELLVEYRRLVTHAVFEHGGTVDKFIGDGVMAVFGQPDPKPDDAERALRCALRLGEMLARWKEERQREGHPALDAGIGLHVGPVIGGIVETGNHDEFTVFGDAVNVAERLDGLSKSLGASLVVSAALMSKVPSSEKAAAWVWKDGIELAGRIGMLQIAYLPRLTGGRIGQGPSLHAQIARA